MTLEFMKHIYRNPIDGFCNTCKRRNQTAVNKNVNPTENYSTIKRKQWPNVRMATKKGTKTELRTSDVPRCHMCKETPTQLANHIWHWPKVSKEGTAARPCSTSFGIQR
jgi:hypothetical protein